MIAIVCVDSENGMMFNKRRQSRDRVVIENIIEYVGDKKLWINGYSSRLFEKASANICVDEHFLDKTREEDYCFVENCRINDRNIKEIILYRWNKKYPADFKLDVDFSKYYLKNTLEFKGYSHDKITREVYVRNEY